LIKNGFASFELKLNSQGIKPLLESTSVPVKVMHVQGGAATEIASVDVPLKDLLKGKLVSTPQSEVRVFDSYQPLDNGGFVRAILYMEDLGEIQEDASNFPAEVTALRYQQKSENKDPNSRGGDELEKQIVW